MDINRKIRKKDVARKLTIEHFINNKTVSKETETLVITEWNEWLLITNGYSFIVVTDLVESKKEMKLPNKLAGTVVLNKVVKNIEEIGDVKVSNNWKKKLKKIETIYNTFDYWLWIFDANNICEFGKMVYTYRYIMDDVIYKLQTDKLNPDPCIFANIVQAIVKIEPSASIITCNYDTVPPAFVLSAELSKDEIEIIWGRTVL